MDPSTGLRPSFQPLNMPWGAPSQPPNMPHQGLPYQHHLQQQHQQQPYMQQQQQQPPSFLETSEQAKLRFQIESEFVQSLANPHYLNYLAQRGYFKEATFVRYLNYLRYFKQPDYAKTLKYPQCLLFLDLLQKPEFREAIASSSNAKFIEDQMLLQWHYYLRKRQRLSQFTTTFRQSPERFYQAEQAPQQIYNPPSAASADDDAESEERSDEPMEEQE
uniref:Mediator of RNA polymerase II transcription subunit 31 n=1 Tax=Panagrolaimus davidi TaxID=227884 RepID=A0A914Q1P1_9BILA